jgi:hypothetical protein
MKTPRQRGSRQLDWRALMWFRFRQQSGESAPDRKMLRDLILDNFVSLTIPAPCSDRGIVEKIAAHARKPIPIDYLCSDLDEKVSVRGQTVFCPPGDHLDEIAQDYPGLYWWLSEKGLRMEILRGDGRIPSFDQFAGRLMSETGPTTGRKYRSQADFNAIAEQLDKAGFVLGENLQGQHRKELALCNQKNPRKKIATFSEAIQPKKRCGLRRGVLRRLYDAESKFRNRAG